MTHLGKGLDYGLSLLACGVISLLVFGVSSRWLSPTAGGLLAVVALVATVVYMADSIIDERRAENLIAGLCPSCHQAVEAEHQHRRWNSERQQWLEPVQSWDCQRCGYSHSVKFVCATCPEAA